MPCGYGAGNAQRRWRNRARTATRAAGGARQRLRPARSAAVEGPLSRTPSRFPLRGASTRSERRRGEAAANGAPFAGGSRQMAKGTAERRRGVCGRAELSEGGGRRALPVVSRAGKTSISGHQTAFWHAPTLLWRALACADSADLGFRCERSSFSVGKRRIPCQNAVPWPKIRISAAWRSSADAFSSVSFASGVLAARAPLRRAPRAHAAASTVVAWCRVRASFEGRCVFRPAPVESSSLWIRALSRASHPGTFKAAKGWAMPHRMRGVADGRPFPIASGA